MWVEVDDGGIVEEGLALVAELKVEVCPCAEYGYVVWGDAYSGGQVADGSFFVASLEVEGCYVVVYECVSYV